MVSDEDVVTNAADDKQLKEVGKSEKFKRKHELDDMRAILSLPAGRRFIWRLMKHCRVWESIWHPSALIHHNSGMQDVGHFVLAEVNEAKPTALLEMIQENNPRETK